MHGGGGGGGGGGGREYYDCLGLGKWKHITIYTGSVTGFLEMS